MQEFAITDDRGQLFGLPAKTFTSKEAATAVLSQLQQRRADMAREAQQAQAELDAGGIKLVELRDRARETVARWQTEQPRTYTVITREVGPWKAVA